MQSHCYSLSGRDWLRLLLPPVVGFACVAALAQLILHLSFRHPSPSSATTLDDVILAEKARLSSTRQPGPVLFIGDSSCMMDLDLGEITRLCPDLNGCNLGSLSTLGLPRFTTFLQSYLDAQGLRDGVQLTAAANHATGNSPLRLVVILISPEMVRTAHQPIVHKRNQEQERKRRELLAQNHADRPRFDITPWLARFYDLTAVSRLRTDVADRLIEHPLPGHWGERYGSFLGVHDYLATHAGCAIDPSERGEGPVAPPLRSAELAPTFLNQCRDFAKRLPPSVDLAVGLTPVPQSEVEPGYPAVIHDVLNQLKRALNATTALTNLPPSLPDHLFSTSTHLNDAGALQYSHSVCRALRQAGLAHESRLAANAKRVPPSP